jgi:hypothetical protein
MIIKERSDKYGPGELIIGYPILLGHTDTAEVPASR